MKKTDKTTTKPKENISRRTFLGSTAVAAATATFTIVPRHVLGGAGNTPPSEKLGIAGIGIGGMGKNNVAQCAGENIVALCDVDRNYAGKVFKDYPQAKVYTDYRQMLESQKDIDAVIIATPDHTHAVIAMAAMQLGKHVYCQKPLTHSVHEARMLTETARKYNVATQMGNQGHSGEGMRVISEWIADGAIGPVREVNAWTNRPIWPQAIGLPLGTPPPPSTLDWDLWLGPAKWRPYHHEYLPFNWRGWWDFGTGALGDMACHLLDPVFSALKLQYPSSVEAYRSKIVGRDRGKSEEAARETFPAASIVHYRFPARGDMPAVKLNWYDGGLMPERPDELESGRRMGSVIFVGDKGKIMTGEYGDSPRIIPESAMRGYERPPKTLDRIPGGREGHEKDWVRACKGGKPASSNFDYSGPLTEMVVMGNLAIRYPGKRLEWDGANMTVTNFTEANDYVRRDYRKGWSL